MKYAKPALSFQQQVQLLASRGLQINDQQRAEHYLAHINYYRLAGYCLPFEAAHQFRPGVRFEDVIGLYVFDRELRLLVLDAIERIEVSVRTQWAYHFAHEVSPHGYLDAQHAHPMRQYARQLAILAAEVERSKEASSRITATSTTNPTCRRCGWHARCCRWASSRSGSRCSSR